MALQALKLRPGVNRDGTIYSAKGGWYDCNNVRFRDSRPEKIGGWAKNGEFDTSDPLPSNSLIMEGIARDYFSWAANDGSIYAGIGTSWKYYVDYSGLPYDITPLRNAAAITLTNPFTVNTTYNNVWGSGTTQVKVADTAHGAVVNDYVTFSGSAAVGGVAAATLNAEHQIVEVESVDVYWIKVTGAATSNVAGGGGSVTTYYQINTGLDTALTGSGWGVGFWGRGTYGTFSATDESSSQLRLWSTDNFGQDIVLSPRGGGLYYWQKSERVDSDDKPKTSADGRDKRAIEFSTVTGAIQVPSSARQVLVSDRDGHVVCLGCNDISGTTALSTGTMNTLLVRWADQENPFDWLPTNINTSGGQQLTDGSEIVGGLATKSEILIWTDTSLHSMRYIGPPSYFGFDLVTNGTSLFSPRAAVAASSVVYFMGEENFYSYAGAVSPIPCTVEKYVFDDINTNQKYKVFAALNSKFNEVMWFYPSSYSQEVDRYVCFNYAENVWTIGNFDMSAISTSETTSSTTVYSRTAWQDSKVANNPRAPFIYEYKDRDDSSGTVPGVRKSAIYDHEVRSAKFNADGQSMTSYIQSGDIEIGDGERLLFCSKFIPDINFISYDISVDGKDSVDQEVTVTLSGKEYPQSTTTTFDRSQTITSDTAASYLRGRARSINLKYESTGLNYSWRLGDSRIEIKPDGRR